MNIYRPLLTACGMYVVKLESSITDLWIWDTVKLQIFVRYPFSYF